MISHNKKESYTHCKIDLFFTEFVSYKRNKQRAHKMPPIKQPQPQQPSKYPTVSNVRFTTKPTNGNSNIIDTNTQRKY
jgi:hypothetical protein